MLAARAPRPRPRAGACRARSTPSAVRACDAGRPGAGRTAPRVRPRWRGARAPRPRRSPSHRSTSTDIAPMLTSPYRGAPSGAEITPVEPDPAQYRRRECSDTKGFDDRRLRQWRRRRHPGRPEGVRRRRRVRHVGDRRADRAEHGRRDRRARAARRVRDRAARRGLLRHRRRRREDGHALLARGDRGGRGLPRRSPGAARRRPGDDRVVRRAAAAGRRGRRARVAAVPARRPSSRRT